MSERPICVFVSEIEFSTLCENRIDLVCDRLLKSKRALKELNPDYDKLSKNLNDIMLQVSKVKLDIEEIARKNGGTK